MIKLRGLFVVFMALASLAAVLMGGCGGSGGQARPLAATSAEVGKAQVLSSEPGAAETDSSHVAVADQPADGVCTSSAEGGGTRAAGCNPFSKGWCTWYAAQKWNCDWGYGLPSRRDAKYWYDDGGRYRRGGSPQERAIMVLNGWGSNPYGHVAIVERVLGGSSFEVSHMNWQGFNVVSRETFQISGSSVKRNGKTYPLKGFIYRP